METESVRKLIDICAEAAHLEHMLPKLPAGLTPRCIRVVDQVASLTTVIGTSVQAIMMGSYFFRRDCGLRLV